MNDAAPRIDVAHEKVGAFIVCAWINNKNRRGELWVVEDFSAVAAEWFVIGKAYVCDQLGHSSIQITFDTYGHLFPQSRREASKKLEEAMYAKKKSLVENLVENPPKEPPPGGKTRRTN